MARRGRSQFQFTVVELIVLAVSFAVTSFLVFMLGLYVGREVAGRHGPPRESVARIPAAPAPVAETDSEADSRADYRAQSGTDPDDAAAGAEERPGEAGDAADGAAAVPGAAAVGAGDAAAGGVYTVQVLATRNSNEADAMRDSLEKKGVEAFIAPVEDAGGSWYRVRIGRFADAAGARRMAERCRRELGLGQAYVSPL